MPLPPLSFSAMEENGNKNISGFSIFHRLDLILSHRNTEQNTSATFNTNIYFHSSIGVDVSVDVKHKKTGFSRHPKCLKNPDFTADNRT